MCVRIHIIRALRKLSFEQALDLWLFHTSVLLCSFSIFLFAFRQCAVRNSFQ